MRLLLVAVLAIYMVLGILYESFIHPFTILSALPFAGFGVLVTLAQLLGPRLHLYTRAAGSGCARVLRSPLT